MGMKMTVKGLDDYITALHDLDADTDKIIKSALYDGAGVLIEEVKSRISALPEDRGYKQKGVQRNVATPDEKKDLLEHIGIAHFAKKGDAIGTAIGFNGYSRHKTKKYRQGVPIPLIARSIESGSSVRQKHPFMRQSVKAVQDRIAAMAQEKIVEEINKKMEG